MTKPPTDMDAMTYWKWYGKPHCERLATTAGTSYSYWKHICNRTKRPSVELARALVEASNGELSFEKLLFPLEEMRNKDAA